MTDTAAAALLAIWLHSVTMVAYVNLATAKKDGCAKNRPNTDHTWESIGESDHTWESIMTDTAAAALLAIWLRLLTIVASVNLATAKKDGCAKNGPNTDHTWESIGDTDHTWETIGDRHHRRQRHQT